MNAGFDFVRVVDRCESVVRVVKCVRRRGREDERKREGEKERGREREKWAHWLMVKDDRCRLLCRHNHKLGASGVIRS